jgi:hypothetical protein
MRSQPSFYARISHIQCLWGQICESLEIQCIWGQTCGGSDLDSKMADVYEIICFVFLILILLVLLTIGIEIIYLHRLISRYLRLWNWLYGNEWLYGSHN